MLAAALGIFIALTGGVLLTIIRSKSVQEEACLIGEKWRICYVNAVA